MKYSRLFWGLLVIMFGVIILGLNLGFWTNDVWSSLLELWPLLLVLIGINLIFGENNPIALILLSLVIIFGILYTVDYRGVREKVMPESIRQENNNKSVKKQNFSYDIPSNLKDANYKINIGAADIKIGADTENKLYQGFFNSFNNLNTHVNVSNGSARITLEDKNFSFHINSDKDFQRELNLKLNREVPSDLDINTGASNLDLDLSDLKIKNLSIDAGASKQEVKLGSNENKINAKISAGVSKVVISVPKDFALKVTSDTALSSTNFSELGLSQNGKTYTSENFDNSPKQLILNVSSGASTININRY